MNYTEPVEQVLTKIFGVEQLLEAAVGRGHDPYVNAPGFGRAHRPHFLLLQHAQQFHLECLRGLRDFIKEDRSAARGLEDPPMIACRAGKCAARVTEEFRFEQGLGECATVDRHEWPSGAEIGRASCRERV